VDDEFVVGAVSCCLALGRVPLGSGYRAGARSEVFYRAAAFCSRGGDEPVAVTRRQLPALGPRFRDFAGFESMSLKTVNRSICSRRHAKTPCHSRKEAFGTRCRGLPFGLHDDARSSPTPCDWQPSGHALRERPATKSRVGGNAAGATLCMTKQVPGTLSGTAWATLAGYGAACPSWLAPGRGTHLRGGERVIGLNKKRGVARPRCVEVGDKNQIVQALDAETPRRLGGGVRTESGRDASIRWYSLVLFRVGVRPRRS